MFVKRPVSLGLSSFFSGSGSGDHREPNPQKTPANSTMSPRESRDATAQSVGAQRRSRLVPLDRERDSHPLPIRVSRVLVETQRLGDLMRRVPRLRLCVGARRDLRNARHGIVRALPEAVDVGVLLAVHGVTVTQVDRSLGLERPSSMKT